MLFLVKLEYLPFLYTVCTDRHLDLCKQYLVNINRLNYLYFLTTLHDKMRDFIICIYMFIFFFCLNAKQYGMDTKSLFFLSYYISGIDRSYDRYYSKYENRIFKRLCIYFFIFELLPHFHLFHIYLLLHFYIFFVYINIRFLHFYT